jgi:hypothetical protein
MGKLETKKENVNEKRKTARVFPQNAEQNKCNSGVKLH